MSKHSLPTPAALCSYPKDTPMLLALSGGADSRLLLHLCAETARTDGAVLHLCHVHHGIRGKEADRDEAFCRSLAERYALPIHILHADIPAIARESGETVEEAARRIRYDYFASLMREYHIPLLLTAHHATDNMETVLFRLCRGTGLAGLGGIMPVRPFPAAEDGQMPLPPVLVRPLLSLSREDVLAACERDRLDYVTDSTNADVSYTRNRIRAEVLPALATVVEHPERQVLRLCETLREDEQLLCSLAKQLLAEARRGDTLLRERLAASHPSLAKRALRLWVHELTGQMPEAVHLDAILALCGAGATGHAASIGGCRVRADREVLSLVSDDPETPVTDYLLPLTEGEHEIAACGIHVSFARTDDHRAITLNSNRETNVYNPFIRDTLTFDIIIPYVTDGSLYLRPRHEGDRILLGGMHRRVRKLQNERGIPPALRDRLPLLCDGEGVLWVPGVGLRDGACQNDAPTACVRVTLCQSDTASE